MRRSTIWLVATLATLSTPALADDLIVSVGDRIDLRGTDGLELSGNWARVYPAEGGGWHLFLTGGDTYNVLEMSEDFTVTSTRQRLVTDWPVRLVDHQIAACPDGTWLHVASANVDRPNDSAYLFRYDSEFNLLCSATVGERSEVYAFNDAPLVCTGGATAENPMDGTAIHLTASDPSAADTGMTADHQAPFQFFDGDCEPSHAEPHPTTPNLTGASVLYDAEGGYFWEARSTYDHPEVMFQLYGAWMEPQDRFVVVDTLAGEFNTHWPQAFVAVGDYYVLAHLARDPEVLYNSDKGDIYVQVFDRDLAHVQSVRVTELGAGSGAHRPWLSWRDDTLVLVYDQDLMPRLVPMTLNPALLDSPTDEPTDDPPDSGAPVSDSGTHGGDGDDPGATDNPTNADGPPPTAAEPSEAAGSGCSAAGGLPGLGLAIAGLWGAAIRRRRISSR